MRTRPVYCVSLTQIYHHPVFSARPPALASCMEDSELLAVWVPSLYVSSLQAPACPVARRSGAAVTFMHLRLTGLGMPVRATLLTRGGVKELAYPQSLAPLSPLRPHLTTFPSQPSPALDGCSLHVRSCLVSDSHFARPHHWSISRMPITLHMPRG